MDGSFADLATLLARGISHARMYFAGHPNVAGAAIEFRGLLRRLLPDEPDAAFELGITEGRLVHDGRLLVGPSIVGGRLGEFASMLGAGGFRFARTVEHAELMAFFGLATESLPACADHDEARTLLVRHGIASITPLPLFRRPDALDDVLDDLVPVYRAMFDTVESAHNHAQRDRALDMNDARTSGASLVQAAKGSLTDIMALVQYPDFDSFTVGHSVRVAMLTVLAGREAGVAEETLTELAAAALLHDVGKGKIPQEILFKPGKLDAEERRVIETHPAIGAAMLLETRDAGPLAVASAWGHHRRYDGGGYPKMPYGDATSQLTQLIHVCDVFEALTAVRPYKRAMTPRDAFEIILQDRAAYSPLAITALRNAVGLYPPGSRVVLSTGHQAVVTAANRLVAQPRVRITHGPDGQEVPAERQPEVDLATHPAGASIQHLLLGT